MRQFHNACFRKLVSSSVSASPSASAVGSFSFFFSSSNYVFHGISSREFSSINPNAPKDRKTYNENMKIVRKKYMEEFQMQKAKKDAEDANKQSQIREAKRNTLLYKRELQKLSTEKAQKKLAAIKERFELRLKLQQEIREKKNAEYEKKIKNLLGTYYKESSHWITLENIDEKIGPHLFANAGSSTGLVTDKSIHWKYLALPDVPDFTKFRDDDLFDINEDSHFLTTRSPYLQDLEIPPESIYYTPGIITKRDMIEEENRKISADEKVQISLDEAMNVELDVSGESTVEEEKNGDTIESQQVGDMNSSTSDFEEPEEEDDGFIYMEDAIYRPIDNAELPSSSITKGKPQSPITMKNSGRLDAIPELNMVTTLAEKYEQLLYSQLEDEDRLAEFLDESGQDDKKNTNETNAKEI